MQIIGLLYKDVRWIIEKLSYANIFSKGFLVGVMFVLAGSGVTYRVNNQVLLAHLFFSILMMNFIFRASLIHNFMLNMYVLISDNLAINVFISLFPFSWKGFLLNPSLSGLPLIFTTNISLMSSPNICPPSLYISHEMVLHITLNGTASV